MRSALAQGTATEQLASGPAVTVRSSASVFSMWPASVAPGVLAPAQEASFRWVSASSAVFPYGSYTTGSNPAGWLLDQRVLQRTARGQVIEQVDGCAIATSIIYSADLTFPVAHFANTPAGAAAYQGFEPLRKHVGLDLDQDRFGNRRCWHRNDQRANARRRVRCHKRFRDARKLREKLCGGLLVQDASGFSACCRSAVRGRLWGPELLDGVAGN